MPIGSISVIIPAYNPDPVALMDCLRAIAASALPALEVILVDDGSSRPFPDEIHALCRFVRHEQNCGPATARNAGAAAAQGDVVCFVDADVRIGIDTLAEIARTLEDESVTAVQTIYAAQTPVSNFISQYQNLYMHFNFFRLQQTDICTLSSHCIAMRRSAFLAVGGFDEGIAHASVEDENLGLKLYFAGHTIRLAKHIRVQHLDHVGLKRIVRRMFYMGSDRVESFLRTPRTRQIDLGKTHHPLSLVLSILMSPILLLPLLPGIHVAQPVVVALVALFVLINRDFFRFIAAEKGMVFTLKSIFLYYLVCLSIVLGCVNGVRNYYAI